MVSELSVHRDIIRLPSGRAQRTEVKAAALLYWQLTFSKRAREAAHPCVHVLFTFQV